MYFQKTECTYTLLCWVHSFIKNLGCSHKYQGYLLTKRRYDSPSQNIKLFIHRRKKRNFDENEKRNILLFSFRREFFFLYLVMRIKTCKNSKNFILKKSKYSILNINRYRFEIRLFVCFVIKNKIILMRRIKLKATTTPIRNGIQENLFDFLN